MKKLITLSLIGLSFCTAAIAQKGRGNMTRMTTAPAPLQAVQKTSAVVSGVLFPASFEEGSPCADDINVYSDTAGSYYAGTNRYGDKEVMMRYKLSEFGLGLPATVDTVLAFFGTRSVTGNGKVRAKIYSATAAGAPGTLLGTSAELSISAIDTDDVTNFVFATPVTITTSSFFAAVDVSSLYATGDAAGLFTTNDECESTDPTGAWTKTSNNSFFAFSNEDSGWNFALDIAIFAHSRATQLSVSSASNHPFAASVYPAPASNTLTVVFTGVSNDMTMVSIKDMAGRQISATTVASVPGGSYKIPVNVSNFSNGLYFIEITSGSRREVLKAAIRQ